MSQVSKIDEILERLGSGIGFIVIDSIDGKISNRKRDKKINREHNDAKQALLSAILEVKPDKFLAKKPPIVYGSDVPYSRLANAAHGAGYNTALDEWEATIKELFS